MRTRGSISQCLLKRINNKDDHVTDSENEENLVRPWYEQEVQTRIFARNVCKCLRDAYNMQLGLNRNKALKANNQVKFHSY